MMKSNTSEFIVKAQKIYGFEKYSYDKVEYKNNKTKVIITCNVHGDFIQRPTDHLSGYECANCRGKKKSNTLEFIKKCASIKNEQFYKYDKVIYKNNRTPVIITCLTHGDFRQTPYEHLNGGNCPKCVGKNKTTEEYIALANQIHNFEFDYEETIYVNASKKIVITCRKHGNFIQKASNHTNLKQRCPKCNHSSGEKIIEQFLDKNNIIYKIQYKFKDCKHKKSLPFDFAILDDSKNIICLIEYNGIQHYKATKFCSSISEDQIIEKFNQLQYRDKIKTIYCRDKNIPLLTISYIDKNKIQELLIDFLANLPIFKNLYKY